MTKRMRPISTAVTPVLAAAALAGAAPNRPTAPLPWGLIGHQMAARAAHQVLPSDMPAFFREAGDQLVYLDPEPDRWRNGDLTEMDQAWSYDHYIDLENIPDGAPCRARPLRVLEGTLRRRPRET